MGLQPLQRKMVDKMTFKYENRSYFATESTFSNESKKKNNFIYLYVYPENFM